MPFFSLDDDVAAVIAVGTRPTGIIAMGLMPTGVIAIGACAVGVVAVGVGAAAGGLTIACGATCSVFSLGVGGYASFLPSMVVGGGISVIDDDDGSDSTSVSETYDHDAPELPKATELALLESGVKSEGWVAARGVGGALRRDDEPLDVTLSESAAEALRDVDGPVRAFMVASRVPDGGARGYREDAGGKVALTCTEIVVVPARKLKTVRRGWSAWRMLKALLFVGAVAVMSLYARGRWLDATLPRLVEARWPATVHETSIDGVTECVLTAKLRSDGQARFITRPAIKCRRFELAADDLVCAVGERANDDGTFSHTLACARGEVPPDDDSEGQPRIDIDTRQRRIVIQRTHGNACFLVHLEVAEWSETRSKTRLVDPR
ncbi:MAG: hypothetical protein KF819_29155 [Labilithrix sp.]|nr:hypothetical protein [Labilithrix sp.]